ncbi:conserved hypothetical protein [Vibrio harveyi]|nr:conserved hypothetical protein [Vibrio harveyi]CAH1532061.1 conserved hypothetical protein [Vibrio harveyi]CAH1560288.1 conserved hypothetical protein [Vibrio harveyi]CAH1566005.1 conserved hypothetical protein [Vibrio harveyi]
MFMCKTCKICGGFVIKVYLYIVVETQDIGVHLFASYKIVLLPQFFKAQVWDDLWITNKIKKNSK